MEQTPRVRNPTHFLCELRSTICGDCIESTHGTLQVPFRLMRLTWLYPTPHRRRTTKRPKLISTHIRSRGCRFRVRVQPRAFWISFVVIGKTHLIKRFSIQFQFKTHQTPLESSWNWATFVWRRFRNSDSFKDMLRKLTHSGPLSVPLIKQAFYKMVFGLYLEKLAMLR